MKKAFITGVTGQDGSYLAELLLEKGYEVHGVKRRTSVLNTSRVDHIYEDINISNKRLHLYYSDLVDSSSLLNLLADIKPDEIYNLAAQSHVGVSFEIPEYTSNVDGLGTLRLLESMRSLKLTDTRFYQASTSELYGKVLEIPQNEQTPFYPRSPYGVSKLYSYWITVNYREAYNFFACNGILFNHESPRRGETFVTRKITRGLSRICQGLSDCLYLGNLDALRDWGHAKDFVEAQWMILQQDKPDDYVIATGKQYSVREFIIKAASRLGIEIEWSGHGLEEVGKIKSLAFDCDHLKNGQTIIKVDKRYFRPSEVETLLGDSAKARKELNWQPKISFEKLVEEMVEHDLKDAILEKTRLTNQS